MKLFKWNIKDIKPRFPNIIEKFFGNKITDEAATNEDVSVIPSVNIADVDKAFEVSVAVPGLDKKDVKIEIQDNCLVVSSEEQYKKKRRTKTGCAESLVMPRSSVNLNYRQTPIRIKYRQR